MKLSRDSMISLLHELDRALHVKLDIEICGASSAILCHGLNRSSTDIDIIRSSIPFGSSEIQKAVESVSIRHGTTNTWINDESKEVLNKFPNSYKIDLTQIPGEIFDNLNPKVISKADFIITKLAFFDNMRQWDISDIQSVKLKQKDVSLIFKKLDDIPIEYCYNALMIEATLKTIRPDLVKTIHGDTYTSAKEIAEYALERYNRKPLKPDLNEWQKSLDSMTSKPNIMITNLDFNAAKLISNGNNNLAISDMKYRTLRQKSLERGYDI